MENSIKSYDLYRSYCTKYTHCKIDMVIGYSRLAENFSDKLNRMAGEVGMIREYVVKVTDTFLPGAFQRFESEWAPEQELIRCKDCKYCFAEGFVHEHNICDKHEWIQGQPDDCFCADGERR